MAERTRGDATARGSGGPPGRSTKPSTGRSADRARLKARRKGPTRKGGRTAAAASGRYTAPIPRSVRHSPPWYPWLLVGLLVAGVAVIILNYVQALPASPTNWYTLGGIVALLAGTLLATGYR